MSETKLDSSSCSLANCPAGEMTAKLPYFREQPIGVIVHVWEANRSGVTHSDRLVYFQKGQKTDHLSDGELQGAEFYPEND